MVHVIMTKPRLFFYKNREYCYLSFSLLSCVLLCVSVSSRYALFSLASRPFSDQCFLFPHPCEPIAVEQMECAFHCAVRVRASLFWGGLMSLLVKCLMDLSCVANCLWMQSLVYMCVGVCAWEGDKETSRMSTRGHNSAEWWWGRLTESCLSIIYRTVIVFSGLQSRLCEHTFHKRKHSHNTAQTQL